jgi:hypothetical protein
MSSICTPATHPGVSFVLLNTYGNIERCMGGDWEIPCLGVEKYGVYVFTGTWMSPQDLVAFNTRMFGGIRLLEHFSVGNERKPHKIG